MYVPAHFDETRLEVLHGAIEATRLCSLVTPGPDGLEASHLPILLDRGRGRFGTLRGHLARANPQWRQASGTAAGLAIFLGPDAYVSPSWYPSKRQTGKAVPTWNYVAVHAHGPITFTHDRDTLLQIVAALTERHEAGRPTPWSVADAPPDYLEAMLKGIVGFEMVIDRLEGKWKMSQNRPDADRRGVMDGLAREQTPQTTTVARIMRETF